MLLALAACGGGADLMQPNRAPTAIAGPAQTVLAGSTVTLAGSGTDPDLDPLTYLWSFTKPDGSGASLTNTHVATPTFVADIAGVYTAVLTVSDPSLTSSGPSTMTVTAQVPTAAFIKLWDGDQCADSQRIFIIDQHLVYTDSASLHCSDSNFAHLYESTPDRVLCHAGGVTGAPTCTGSTATTAIMQTILNNPQKADLGLGSAHTVQQVYAHP